MVIKNFQIFERGDGVEEENDNFSIVNQSKQLKLDFEQSIKNNKKNLDYVLGLPSGEIVMIDDINDLKLIIDKKLVEWTHSFAGKILNCYATSDNNIEKIKSLMFFLKKEKNKNSGYKKISQEYIDEMQIATGKKFVVAYSNYQNPEYYMIIPDIGVWNNYKDVFHEMAAAVSRISKKYPNAKFSFGSKPNKKEVTYYGMISEED